MEFGAPYTLSTPVELIRSSADGETREMIREVILREPTAADMELMDQYGPTPVRLTLELIAALSGLPLVAVRKMSARDIGPLGDAVFDALPGGPKTGATA